MALILMSINANRLLLFVVLLPFCCSHGSAQYECGSHGRFEYCIDGIPGCVIGCHCHPGYYFDTDTKVCEPNIKLTQEFRRNYFPEPITIQNSLFNSQLVTTSLSPTVTGPIDAKIDEITKDADDLGDWLYNQFFKTIENQVINSTGDNEQVLTRRSGGDVKRKPKRRSRKRWKKPSKKSKRKQKGLKRKLLRITEDDSLFDSSSGPTSDDDSTSSSSESEIDASSESNRSDKDHGHKKIIIFNKKPKPPLPSFIFLPNMDTPFYPPIALPPPPVIPMYPLVPVPPVAPLFPYSGFTTSSHENEINISTSTLQSPLTTTPNNIAVTNGGTTTTAASSFGDVSNSELTSSTTVQNDESTTTKPSFRAGDASLYGKKLKTKNKDVQRNKLLQKLKDKINRRNKVTQMRQFTDDYLDIEERRMDLLPKPDFSRQLQSNGLEDEMPMQDVDFKYITELIHRVDLNNTPKSPKYPRNPEMPAVGRRSFNSNPIYLAGSGSTYLNERPHRARTKEPQDTYYSNLGRQIAAMIRKIDENGERRIDIEVEKDNLQIPEHPVFNENNYASRTFWERSVRSPLTTYFQPRDSKFTYLKNSNENLFNLENIVEVAVTTNPPLSLQEIENIINKMEHANVRAKKKNDSVAIIPSQKSFNVDLLTKDRKTTNWNRNINYNFSTVKYEKVQPRNKFYHFLINSNRKPIYSTSIPITKTDIHKVVFDVHSNKPTRKPQTFNDNALKIPMMDYLKFINHIPILTTTKRPIVYRLNPAPYYRKKANYFTNSNQYIYEKTAYPYFSAIYKKYNNLVAIPSKPSYFHHELHHFDYFDER